MSTVSGISFAPRAIMNPTQKSTINNNYRNTLNTDSFTPMSFKGGRITQAESFKDLIKALEGAEDSNYAKDLKAAVKLIEDYEEIFRDAKCFKNLEIEISNYNQGNGKFTVNLKRGKKILATGKPTIEGLKKGLDECIKKAEDEFSPKGGKIEKTWGFKRFEHNVNKASKKSNTKDSHLERLVVIKDEVISRLQKEFGNVFCSSDYKIKLGGLNGDGIFPAQLEKNGEVLAKSQLTPLDFETKVSELITKAGDHSQRIDEFGPPIEKVTEGVEKIVEG